MEEGMLHVIEYKSSFTWMLEKLSKKKTAKNAFGLSLERWEDLTMQIFYKLT